MKKFTLLGELDAFKQDLNDFCWGDDAKFIVTATNERNISLLGLE